MASWLHNAIHQATKPKHSIIEALKKNLGGLRIGRDRSELHASDITKSDFCPRQWAFFDLQEKQADPQYVNMALDVTFQMGLATERLLVEEWGTGCVIGNWFCLYCQDQRTMVPKPQGFCKDGRAHWWRYRQLRVDAPEYGVSGGIDALFDVGAAQLLITEVKILNTEEFEKIIIPLPEHRLRTNLYMNIIDESHSPYKNKFNVQEARVLYVSRGYGKMNTAHGEILPFKEFSVVRDNEPLIPLMQRAKALKLFREQKGMPSGICATALDPIAKKCSACAVCFSGQFPATIQCDTL